MENIQSQSVESLLSFEFIRDHIIQFLREKQYRLVCRNWRDQIDRQVEVNENKWVVWGRISPAYFTRFPDQTHWETINSFKNRLSCDFINRFADRLDWFVLLQTQKMSEEFIIQNIKRIKMVHSYQYLLVTRQKISIEFIEIYIDKENWNIAPFYQNLGDEALEKYADHWNWVIISKYWNKDISFIRRFKKWIKWDSLAQNRYLTPDIVIEFADQMHWQNISRYYKMSENVMSQVSSKLHWSLISRYQVLSESFIERYKKRVVWSLILKYQTISPEFREKHALASMNRFA